MKDDQPFLEDILNIKSKLTIFLILQFFKVNVVYCFEKKLVMIFFEANFSTYPVELKPNFPEPISKVTSSVVLN